MTVLFDEDVFLQVSPKYKRVYSLIIHLFLNSHSCRDNNQLVANYSFVEGDYITSMTIQSGGRLDGFTMETNIRTYPYIVGTGGRLKPPATGQRLLFVSGAVNDYNGDHHVSHVRFYFDIC